MGKLWGGEGLGGMGGRKLNSKTKTKSIPRYRYSYLVSSSLPLVFILVNHLPLQEHRMILEWFLSSTNHVMSPFAFSLRWKVLHPKIASRCKNRTFLLWFQIFYPFLFYQSLWAKILHCAYVVGFIYIHIYLYLPLSLSPPLHSITRLLEGGKTSTSVYCRGLPHLFLSSLEHLGDWFWSICQKLIATRGFMNPSYVGMLSQPTHEGWLLFAWQICVVNSFGSFSTFTRHSTQKLIQANWNPWANPFCVPVVSRGVISWDLQGK